MKARIIEIMGKCCQICFYNKSNSALELHHIDPSKKELSFGQIRANPRSWTLIFDELLKCILLCANCHREIHDGTSTLPQTYVKPDESFRNYKSVPVRRDNCPVCGSDKLKVNRTCSFKCSATIRSKLDWSSINLRDLLEKHNFNFCAVGRLLNVSDNAVRKHYKRL